MFVGLSLSLSTALQMGKHVHRWPTFARLGDRKFLHLRQPLEDIHMKTALVGQQVLKLQTAVDRETKKMRACA